MPQSFRFLTEADVRRVLPPSRFPALVELMEATLRDFSARRSTQPVRTAVPLGPPGHYLGVMPALLGDGAGLGTKLVSVVPGNAARGLPTHLAVVVMLDPVTGGLTAIIDGRYITEVRTAAVSAVSVKWMARPDATRLAIIGTGVQARSHLEVLAAVWPVGEVRAWSPDRGQLDEYAREMSASIGLEVAAAGSAEAAVRDAGIVVLATSADRPVIRDEWVSHGAHVVSVGACRPHQREMDPALVARAHLVVDSRAAALVEAGDIVQSIADGLMSEAHVAAELGDVAAGLVPGRTGPGEVTVFKSLGQAVEDVAAGALALRLAAELGIGVSMRL